MTPEKTFHLENDQILLRALEPEDLELLYKWENDPEIWTVSNTLTPFSRFVLKQYIENSHRDIFQSGQIRFMIDRKPVPSEPVVKTIGTIDLFDFDPQNLRIGIGVLIKEKEERKKGYAGQSLEIIIDYCFSVLLLHQVYCNIPAGNLQSIRLFQSKGFTETGRKKDWLRKADQWEDELIFQLIKPVSEMVL
ncbi:MAG: GNAT family N-acetyltransferase [Bacteroidales bacterium]|nr:GNAT family N-acetyltransferase [Bacteroidales bacterium]